MYELDSMKKQHPALVIGGRTVTPEQLLEWERTIEQHGLTLAEWLDGAPRD